LFAFYATGIIWGIRSVYYWQPSLLDLGIPLTMALVASSWAIVDSRAQGQAIPFWSGWLFFVCAGILIPGYFIWSRGWYGAGLLLLHAFVWYGLCLLCQILGRMIVLFGQ
jgi:hypothetical protein